MSIVVPHFLSIFTAHTSHHPCHFLPMTQSKSVFTGDQSQIGKKPFFHLVFSTIALNSTIESVLYFFLSLTQEWQVFRALDWGLLRGKSSHYYAEHLLYPQAGNLHFWTKIMQVPSISHRMSSFLGCCSLPQTDFSSKGTRLICPITKLEGSTIFFLFPSNYVFRKSTNWTKCIHISLSLFPEIPKW